MHMYIFKYIINSYINYKTKQDCEKYKYVKGVFIMQCPFKQVCL